MDIGTNLNLNRFVNISGIATPLLFFASVILGNFELVVITVIIYLLSIMAFLIQRFGPTNCNAPCCTGKMNVTTRRLSFWTAAMTFTCNECGMVYEAKIFNPDFELTVEVSS